MTKPRVLVVDDSAFARTVLSRALRESHRIDVIGTARDGRDALDRIAELDPDLITLDLTMPELDGIGVLQQLANRPRPRVVVVSMSNVDTELGAEALALGAIALVAKPTALANDRLLEITNELVATLLAAAPATTRAPVAAPVVPALARAAASLRHDLVMVGTSTGGPQALTRLVAALPADFATPLAIALHIPAGYTEALAARLAKLTPLRVIEAFDGAQIAPGMIVLARGGEHLRVVRTTERGSPALYCDVSPIPVRTLSPSVDELFMSGVRAVGRRALGVVLTGMGDDGLIGAREIAAAGGALLVEAEASCIVYGMPRAVAEAGLGASAVPLDRMAREIAHRV